MVEISYSIRLGYGSYWKFINPIATYTSVYNLPYSWKYWQELNLAVGSQIAILNVHVLADLNLAVQYWIAIHICE